MTHLYASAGNDTLINVASGSWLIDGEGNNTYRGGAGDHVFVISNSDRQENIEGGSDNHVIADDANIA